MKQFNLALVGYGLGGRIFHAPFISTTTGLQLKKIMTSNPKNIALAQSEYPEAEITDSYEEIIADKNIDAIVLAIPNHLHFPYAQQAIQQHKHVIIEKPFTISVEEADELIQLATEHQVKLTINHNRRWDSDFLTVQKVIESGSLGKLVEYEAHFDRFRNYLKPNAWKEETVSGSGILYDLGSHLIDQALMLFGKPQSIFADTRKQREGSKVVDQFELLLFYKELKVTLKASMLVRQDLPKFLLFGQEGTFIKYGKDVQETELLSGLRPNNQHTWGKEPTSIHGQINTTINDINFNGTIESELGNYGLFYHNFYQALLGQEKLLVDPKQARDVIKLITAAIESNKRQQVISLENF